MPPAVLFVLVIQRLLERSVMLQRLSASSLDGAEYTPTIVVSQYPKCDNEFIQIWYQNCMKDVTDMTGPQSLAQFHFDKEKSGKILRKWADESGLTRQELSDITGIPLNTLNNSLYGKVQDLTVDRTFKIATATGHCICEYIKLQLENENIDFADKVHVLRDPALVKQKAFDTVIIDDHHTINEKVPDHLLDRFKRVYDNIIEQMRDQIKQTKDSRTIMQEQYKDQIKAIEEAHKETMERADKQIARLEKQVSRLRIALIIETSAIGLLFFVDALVGGRGWIVQSFLRVGDDMSFVRRG